MGLEDEDDRALCVLIINEDRRKDAWVRVIVAVNIVVVVVTLACALLHGTTKNTQQYES